MEALETSGFAAPIRMSATRVPCLDGWRGVAILMVLVAHFAGLPSAGEIGVELFFVLSGRLMAEILFVNKIPLRTFFLRRFSRVYPALVVFIGTLWMLSLLIVRLGISDKALGGYEALSALTFTINYAKAFHWLSPMLAAHVWSLCVEEHSYIVLALVALGFVKSELQAVVVCVTLAVVAMLNGIRLIAEGAGGDTYWRTDVRLVPVFLSAALFLVMRRSKIALWAWVSPVALLIAGISYWGKLPLPAHYSLTAFFLSVSVNTLPTAHAFVHRIFTFRPLLLAGLLSYSLYIWQQPFFIVTGGAWWAVFPAVVAAGASYLLIEKPARRYINRHGLIPWRPRSLGPQK